MSGIQGVTADRLVELQRFAATRASRRWFRGSMVRALGAQLTESERLVEMVAARGHGASTVVLVTTDRVLIARQPAPQLAVSVTVVALGVVTGVESTAAGRLRIRTATGSIDLIGFDPADVVALGSSVRVAPTQRVAVASRRALRRPMSDLEMVAALHDSGVLTLEEFERVRNRLLGRLAVLVRPVVRTEV